MRTKRDVKFKIEDRVKDRRHDRYGTIRKINNHGVIFVLFDDNKNVPTGPSGLRTEKSTYHIG